VAITEIPCSIHYFPWPGDSLNYSLTIGLITNQHRVHPVLKSIGLELPSGF